MVQFTGDQLAAEAGVMALELRFASRALDNLGGQVHTLGQQVAELEAEKEKLLGVCETRREAHLSEREAHSSETAQLRTELDAAVKRAEAAEARLAGYQGGGGASITQGGNGTGGGGSIVQGNGGGRGGAGSKSGGGRGGSA